MKFIEEVTLNFCLYFYSFLLCKIKFELDFVLYYFIKIKKNNVFSTLSSFAIQDSINSKFLFLFLYFVECFDIFLFISNYLYYF